MITRPLSIAFAWLLCSSAAFCQDYTKTPFDATYEQASAMGTNVMRMSSDGKGRMRMETSAHGQKMINISDFPAGKGYAIMEAQKMVMPIKLHPMQGIHDAESAKRLNAKALGTKIVDGHPCHGWEYTNDAGKTTVWVGDDTNCMVKSVTEMPGQGTTSMELKTFSKNAPGDDQFQVPSGYTVMNIPGMPH